jgi:protein-S-isoprenylcysteine O-methyltransferase Ste14
MTTETQPVFARRVAAAARAAWWTLLVGVIVVLLQSVAYLVVAHSACLQDWLTGLLALDPESARTIVFVFMMLVRILLLIWAMICIFLSLWARGLRRAGEA